MLESLAPPKASPAQVKGWSPGTAAGSLKFELSVLAGGANGSDSLQGRFPGSSELLAMESGTVFMPVISYAPTLPYSLSQFPGLHFTALTAKLVTAWLLCGSL